MARNRTMGVLIALTVALASCASYAQNPILTISIQADMLDIPLAGSGTVDVQVENVSVYEADDIEIFLVSGPIELTAAVPIEVLDPFKSATMTVALASAASASEGDAEALFEVTYTYCIGELCFQILEELSLPIRITAAVQPPTDDPTVGPVVVPDPVVTTPADESGQLLRQLLPFLLGAVVLGTMIIARRFGRRWWVAALLLVVIGAGLGLGISLDQDQQAQSIGAVLCTSCVGIEETPHFAPSLSADARARIAALDETIELLYFSAEWCQSCPYAKAMVGQVVELNSLVSYRTIDVDVDREAANHYGIVQSGRTIVPAIYRLDTDTVLFGIEDLEVRLLELLEEES